MMIDDGKQAPADDEGEDEGSSSKDGKDDHLKDDQKPVTTKD